jgi:hypothetical protein
MCGAGDLLIRLLFVRDMAYYWLWSFLWSQYVLFGLFFFWFVDLMGIMGMFLCLFLMCLLYLYWFF